jgi:hypothetical protein
MKKVILWCGLLALLLVGAQTLEALGAPEGASPSSGGGTQLVTMLVTFALIAIPARFFLALLPAFIAKSKGRKFERWVVYGFFLLLIALIHSLAISNPLKKCPHCAEDIKLAAKVCRYCGRDVVPTV